MNEDKTTGQLLRILTSTHTEKELDAYIEQNTFKGRELDFAAHFENLLRQRGLRKADVIRDAQMERTYGYQILNGTRRPGRDKILALCAAAELSLKETQRCLEVAGEAILYARAPRDAVIIYGMERHMDVMKINEMLADKGEPVLE